MTSPASLRFASFVSGGGTTMREILRAVREGLADAHPALVLASESGIGAIEKAQESGMVAPDDIVVLRRGDFTTREAFGEAILAACRDRGVDFILQNGWIPLTPTNVIEAYDGRIINQHPAPLDPGYLDFGGRGMRGRAAIAATLYFAQTLTRPFFAEATAHLVADELDKGDLLKTASIAIDPNETPEELQARLLPVEHRLQIELLADVARGAHAAYKRTHRLILPEEEDLLAEAKEKAIAMYPRG